MLQILDKDMQWVNVRDAYDAREAKAQAVGAVSKEALYVFTSLVICFGEHFLDTLKITFQFIEFKIDKLFLEKFQDNKMLSSNCQNPGLDIVHLSCIAKCPWDTKDIFTVKWVMFAGGLFSLYIRDLLMEREFNTLRITDKVYYTHTGNVTSRYIYKLSDCEFKTPQISPIL